MQTLNIYCSGAILIVPKPNNSHHIRSGPPKKKGGGGKKGNRIGAGLGSPSKLGGSERGSNSFLHVIVWMIKALTVNPYLVICDSWKMKYSSIVGIE